jgi:predicted ATPase
VKLKFRNFGPIQKGSLELRPFTILVGPNQSGKSFAAMAFHAFARSFGRHSSRRFYYHPSYYNLFEIDLGDPETRDLLDGIRQSKTNELLRLTAAQCSILDQLTPTGSSRDSIAASMREVFAADPEILSRYGSKTSDLVFERGDFTARFLPKKSTASTSADLAPQGPIRVGYVDRRRKDYVQHPDGIAIEFAPSKRQAHADPYLLLQDLSAGLTRRLKSMTFRPLAGSLYLPAIRSGLLLSHRLFLSLLVKNVQRIGLEPLSVPQMTGVTADFLQSLLDLDSQPAGQHRAEQLLQRFERELTGGRIYTSRSQKDVMPSYRFKSSSGFDLPLNLVSSTVTEVAPIFLFLRRQISPGTWLIIEEPESHLSPENQAVMARFLASLLSLNIRVMITTHSPFLLEQLNNLILRHSAIKQGQRPQPGSTLDPNVVSAHFFGFDRNKSASNLRPLEVHEHDGIDLSPFTSVYESLYEEAHSLRQD